MQSFKDTKGQIWIIEINVTTIRRIKSIADVDLYSITSGSDTSKALLASLLTDYGLLCDVVYAIIKPQADEKKISDEQFGEAMGGDALANAYKALMEAIVNFIPNPSLRRVVEKQATKLEQTQSMLAQQVETMIDSPQMDEKIKTLAANLLTSQLTLLELSGGSPESLGSIPDPIPSGN